MPGHGVLWLVQALACAAVAWVAAQGLWWFMGPGSPPLAPKPLPALAEQAHRAAARNFFEAQEAPEPSTTSAHSGPPPGTLDPRWKLLGTYVDAAGHSRALMSLDGTTDVVVAHVGDHLPSGHAVAEVRNESVVLDKAGQRAELTLRAAAGGPPGSMGSTGPAGPAGPSGPTGPTAPAAPAGAGPGSGTPPAFVDAQPLPPGARVAPSASPAPFTKDSR